MTRSPIELFWTAKNTVKMEEESLAQFKTPTLMKQDADKKSNHFSGPGTGPQLSTGFQAGVSSGEISVHFLLL